MSTRPRITRDASMSFCAALIDARREAGSSCYHHPSKSRRVVVSKIGFVGLGIMGRPMANNLLKAGHQLVVYDIVSGGMEEVVRAGAEKGASPSDVAGR